MKAILFLKVDGNTNPKIQSIHLEGFPVHKASFSADGEQVIATSVCNKLFYIYDMMGGKIIPVKHIRGEVNCFLCPDPITLTIKQIIVSARLEAIFFLLNRQQKAWQIFYVVLLTTYLLFHINN